jgi:predicted ATP-dependent endonuclease of OLD family
LPWDQDLLATVSETLGSDVETLNEDQVAAFENLADHIRRITYPPADRDDLELAEPSIIEARAETREAVASALVDLAQTERQPTPVRQVLNALDPYYPGIVFFEEDDRDLRSDYQVAVAVQERPAALENLCAVAKLELGDVAAAIDSGRIPHVEKLIEDANAELKRVFSEVWKQSGVYPRFSAPLDGTLRVFIATEGDASYSFPHERSDGLRWFIALHAFLASTGTEGPVLLVDEAETHLHYDAQADLIDALMAQRVAPKVVYTTHSVGCLPPDLGRGIRAVLPAKDAERSEIANSYWSIDPAGQERVGYTPLLFGMGARLLSLTVPRWAVVAEGPSDAILLPSLLREASNLESLGYRVVGGLSELAKPRLSSLPTHGGSVVCLADGDPPGLKRLAQVETAGMEKNRLFDLGDIQADCTLEDLVAPDVFADAVNLELETWAIANYRVDPSTLPSTGRWNHLMDPANTGGDDLSRLSKTRVAQRVVDAQRSATGAAAGGVVDKGLVSPLAKLQKRIRKTLGL